MCLHISVNNVEWDYTKDNIKKHKRAYKRQDSHMAVFLWCKLAF